MWGEFALVMLVMAVILVVPGFLCLRALGARGVWPVLLAPIVSLSLIAIVGQLLALVHIPSSPALLLGVVIVLPAVALFLLRGRSLDLGLPRIEPWVPLVYLVIGAALGYNLFVSRLGEPDALFQAYDVTQHLNLIQAMADSGTFSSLGTSPYLSAADQAIDPFGGGGFYPAAWHVLCALAVQISGCSVPLAINASMFLLAGVAFPLSVLALLSVLLDNSRDTLLCGALVALAFVAFPWNLITFGPVYPNLAGFALVPTAFALFIHLLKDELTPSARVRTLGVLVLSAIGLALCHPNTIFTCVVFLFSYCISRILDLCNTKGWGTRKKLGLSLAFFAICCLFWAFCYKLPAFQGTVTHVWPPFSRPFQQIINILTLSYNFGFNFETAAQLLLGALVVVGAIRALYMPGKRWLVSSYAIACFILLVSATQEGELKQLLAGFWYTDPVRLSAMAAIFAIPLAAIGATWTCGLITGLTDAYNARIGAKTHRVVIFGALAALFLLINFIPEFHFPGLHHKYSPEEWTSYQSMQPRDWPKSVHTTFGDYRAAVEDTYSGNQPLDEGEKRFLEEVSSTVQEDALVINDPMDGSFLAYGIDGLRVYYRNFLGPGSTTETKESRIIRERLCDYATDPEVQAAVEKIDARYVIVLRGGENLSGFINLRGDYDDTLFSGISSITSETPGFTFVCRLGDSKLYEIDR